MTYRLSRDEGSSDSAYIIPSWFIHMNRLHLITIISYLLLGLVLAACGDRGDAGGKQANEIADAESVGPSSSSGVGGENDEAADTEAEVESVGASDRGVDRVYEEMVAALDLTDEQTDRLDDAFELRKQEMGAWRAKHGAQLRQWHSEIMVAAKARQITKMTSAIAKAKPLRHARLRLVAKHKYQILMALPAEKQVEWDAFRLARRVRKVAEPLALGADQVELIRVHSLEVAATIRRTNPAARPLPKAYLTLERTIEAQVLASEQRRQFQPIKERHKLRSLKW